jgi:hypothetical protein
VPRTRRSPVERAPPLANALWVATAPFFAGTVLPAKSFDGPLLLVVELPPGVDPIAARGVLRAQGEAGGRRRAPLELFGC